MWGVGGIGLRMPKQAHLIETQNRACGLSGQLVVIHMEGVDPGPYNRRHNPKVEMTSKLTSFSPFCLLNYHFQFLLHNYVFFF